MKKTLILGALAITFFACSSNSTEEISNEQTTTENTETNEVEHEHQELEEIVLNNGNKWKVVESMLIYIRNMEKAVNEFKGDDYPALAKTIDENITELTTKCTMEGPAHDELHKWLVPFIELSEKFDVATDVTEQEKIYQEFKVSFETFNTYFE